MQNSCCGKQFLNLHSPSAKPPVSGGPCTAGGLHCGSCLICHRTMGATYHPRFTSGEANNQLISEFQGMSHQSQQIITNHSENSLSAKAKEQTAKAASLKDTLDKLLNLHNLKTIETVDLEFSCAFFLASNFNLSEKRKNLLQQTTKRMYRRLLPGAPDASPPSYPPLPGGGGGGGAESVILLNERPRLRELIGIEVCTS